MTTPPTKQGVRRTVTGWAEDCHLTEEGRSLVVWAKKPKDIVNGWPVAVVSLEPENIDALVERAQQAVWDERRKNNWSGSTAKELAAAVVRALLRLPLPKGRGRG